LSIRGAFLQLTTVGFDRFWLTTDVRRHLWSHTSVAGNALEYTGRGRELLIGFLIALAIIMPFQIAYFLVGIEAEKARAFASIPLLVFLYLFGQFAIFRARRYRLTRTIWRGVRFWMTGSGWKYAFLASGWGLLVLFSLGLAYPWRAAALERYKMRHTFYGDLQAEFTGTGKELFKRGWVIWLICVLPLIGIIALSIAAALQGKAFSKAEGLLTTLGVLSIFSLILVPIVWPIFRAIEWRWWAQGIRFGNLTVDCNLRKSAILKLYLFFILVSSLVSSAVSLALAAIGIIILNGVGLPIFGMGEKQWTAFFTDHNVLAGIGIMVGYLIVGLSIGVVQRYFLQHELWRTIASTLTIGNVSAVDAVIAKGDAVNALGEGLADGLDVAGF
jgi:uncharacterized membrane protein YjgN (DUF898 family)